MKLSHKEITRIKETLEMIPSDVVSILEVGCGDGRITNSISHRYEVVGIDLDKEKIKAFHGPKIIADVAQIPFKDLQFDLVLAAEILEHLPEEIFTPALSEIYRISKNMSLLQSPLKKCFQLSGLNALNVDIYFMHGDI